MRAAVLGFAVSAAYWPGLISGSFVPRWAVIAVGLPLVSSLTPRSVPNWVSLALAFLVALAMLSLLGSPYPEAGALDLLFIVLLCGAFFFGAGLESMDPVMKGVIAGTAISAALCVPQYFGWWNPVAEISKPAGLFFSSEVMGEFAALVFVWSARRGWWPIAALMLIPVVLTGSRIGMIAAAVGLIYGWGWRAVVPALALLIVAAIAAVLFAKLGSAEHRVTMWGAAILALSPLGNGLGWTSAAYPYEEFIHSDALQALVELGVGALVLLAVPFASFRGRGTVADRALLVAVCIEVLVSFPLHFPASGFLAAVVAGFMAGTGPLVRVGEPYGGSHDDSRFVWGNAPDERDYVGGGSLGEPLPDRSLLARYATLRPAGDHAYPI